MAFELSKKLYRGVPRDARGNAGSRALDLPGLQPVTHSCSSCLLLVHLEHTLISVNVIDLNLFIVAAFCNMSLQMMFLLL